MKKLFSYLFAFTILISCEYQSQKSNGNDLQVLTGNEFVFLADRIAMHPDMTFPLDSIPESEYIESESPTRYTVLFSEDGMSVTISDSISGSIISESPTCRKYNLSAGLFAGGRFVVCKSDLQFEAEFTIYGSGVPVIRSERGILEPK